MIFESEPLFAIPEGIETRWASPENGDGEKGVATQKNGGGEGTFSGLKLGVIADTGTYFRTWWGEGECKVYLDGDTEFPTLSGTGTEDYIGTEMDLEAMVKENRGNIFEREDDWSRCAYFYLDKPTTELPELPPAEARITGLYNPEDTSKRADM